ncbi:MAG: divalent-cation tolerance protein CutA [Nevskiaceae bacterium]|jgi:periplasmic divalent cation tolerance protein
MAKDVLVVLVTCPPEKAQAIAGALVEERVAACVNVVPSLSSVYRWKGAVHNDAEALLLVKTSKDRFEALKQAVLKHHPYELPEVIAIQVDRGHAPYLEWVIESSH